MTFWMKKFIQCSKKCAMYKDHFRKQMTFWNPKKIVYFLRFSLKLSPSSFFLLHCPKIIFQYNKISTQSRHERWECQESCLVWIFLNTVFLRIVSEETNLFRKWKMCKFSYSFCIMAIFCFINWIVAAKTIEGGNYSSEETIPGNTVEGIGAKGAPVAVLSAIAAVQK